MREKPFFKSSAFRRFLLVILLVILYVAANCLISTLGFAPDNDLPDASYSGISDSQNYVSEGIPPYAGEPFAILNENIPKFYERDKTLDSFEKYSDFDELGRCGIAYANISAELMPTEERESISDVTPSGWKYNGKSNNNKYDAEIVEGGYLYNRCHLIGFQLAGENANKNNLVTGTRYLNVNGMLPFENMVHDYIKETGNHVLYRVTPCFVAGELVPRGVQIEAFSVEDNGYGICFNVYCYNVQPGIEINYLTGENHLAE